MVLVHSFHELPRQRSTNKAHPPPVVDSSAVRSKLHSITCRHQTLFPTFSHSLGNQTMKVTMAKSADKPAPDLHIRGTHRLRDAETNEIVLVPTPSEDPADPLRWSV